MNDVVMVPISGSFPIKLYAGPTYGCTLNTHIDFVFLFPTKLVTFVKLLRIRPMRV